MTKEVPKQYESLHNNRLEFYFCVSFVAFDQSDIGRKRNATPFVILWTFNQKCCIQGDTVVLMLKLNLIDHNKTLVPSAKTQGLDNSHDTLKENAQTDILYVVSMWLDSDMCGGSHVMRVWRVGVAKAGQSTGPIRLKFCMWSPCNHDMGQVTCHVGMSSGCG